ncbi:LOW QUALITY PROTEIN: Cytochrome P450 [Geosmithia morbida]|uniref:Cytochrome P450 n=1 Tax=Geosmithia morbida TaxID=1094350 RepID=A0A9P4YXX3_9HYPO|nr:LOW QUALITY PROTEIN: Cytochrome P450 [Geosmithia morbida]KAF4124075.1 LOW QUALITY PROTEIN: Cytochrome P450 [Geosmithia morbida]
MACGVISSVGFGAPLGLMEEGNDIGGPTQGIHDGLVMLGIVARLYPFADWIKTTSLAEYLVSSPEQESGIGTLTRFHDRLIQQLREDIRNGTAGERMDLLQRFAPRNPLYPPLDPDNIIGEILLVLLAGAGMTGTALQAPMVHLFSNPDVYDKLMRGIDDATRSGKISPSLPEYENVLDFCPSYVACIRESMRLDLSAPNVFLQLAREG